MKYKLKVIPMSNGKIIKWDENEIDTHDHVTDEFYILTRREATILLALIPFIQWRTRWNLVTYDQQYLLDLASEIAHRLMTPMTIEIQTCADVEDCLTTSPTITTINSNISTNTTAAADAAAAASAAQSTADAAQQAAEEAAEEANANDYEPYPTSDPAEENELCAASWEIARELNAYIQDVIIDASTITLKEFMRGIFGLGGFKESLAKQLWDLIISLANPNLDTEVSGAIENVAEHFYCNELNIAAAITDIDADSNITDDAQAAYIAAINSWTSGKLSFTIAYGRNGSDDCSSFCIPHDWVYTFDFTQPAPNLTTFNGTVDGTSLYYFPAAGGFAYYHFVVIDQYPGATSPITRLEATARTYGHNTATGEDRLQFVNSFAGLTVHAQEVKAPGVDAPLSELSIVYENPAGLNVNYPRIRTGIVQPGSHPVHYQYLDSLKIWGFGTNPFI